MRLAPSCRPFLDRYGQGHGTTEQVPLPGSDAMPPQPLPLRFSFDAFGQGVQLQSRRHGLNHLEQSVAGLFGSVDPLHKRSIDFQDIKGIAVEAIE